MNSALQSVPTAEDQMSMLEEYEVPTNQNQAQERLLNIRQKYNTIMRWVVYAD